ncbi:MAG: hypothetical protein ABI091_24115 [Ferruginibacter sp.]
MNKSAIIAFIITIITIGTLKAQRKGGDRSGVEKMLIHVDTCQNFLIPSRLTGEDAPTFNERSGRGIFIPIIAGYLITKGVQEITKIIDNRKNRYIAHYSFTQRDNYFYDQVSTVNSMDPTGLQFKGFKILRLLSNKNRQPDTLFYAKFILDTTEGRFGEIVNTGIFRLRLDSIMVVSPKVKAPKNIKKINIDVEVDFTTSYRSDNGQFYSDAPLGKFIYSLRNAPLFGDGIIEKNYYNSIDSIKPKLTGECFMVPRSSGFYKTKNGELETCYGHGLYSINISVKETSKPKFIDKIMVLTSDPTLNVVPSYLQKKYGTGATTSAKPSKAPKK